MTSRSMSAGKARTLAELAVLTALTVGGKEAMAALPNINPVTLLLLLAVLVYGWRAMYVAIAFVGIEVGLYGAGVWVLMYLYIWPLLIVCAMPFRRNRSRLFWAAFAGIFGLCFGALCSIPYIFLGGFGAAFAYWVSGIPFDLLHCAGNAALCFVLLLPLYELVEKLRNT